MCKRRARHASRSDGQAFVNSEAVGGFAARNGRSTAKVAHDNMSPARHPVGGPRDPGPGRKADGELLRDLNQERGSPEGAGEEARSAGMMWEASPFLRSSCGLGTTTLPTHRNEIGERHTRSSSC